MFDHLQHMDSLCLGYCVDKRMKIAFTFWFDKEFIDIPKSDHPPHTIDLVNPQKNTCIQMEATYTSSDDLD